MTLQDYIDSIRHQSIAVIGIGVSNIPLLRLLCANGCRVTACDRRSMAELGEVGRELEEAGCSFRLGEDYLEDLREELIFRTPGLMPFDPHLAAAVERGSTLTSEMEVFLALCPCRTFAVTGSDGKTTTTTIISELLREQGYGVHLGGNIGKPLLCELPEIRPTDVAVLELSSFQLHSMTCRPDVAVITNLSPNHLDKHKDFQDYVDAKASIFRNQRPEDRLILNRDDPHTPYYRSLAHSRISYFSDRSEIEEGCVCRDGRLYYVPEGADSELLHAEEIRIPGEHNVQNYLAAFEAVRGWVSAETCRKVAMRFPGVPHRLEEVRVRRGVTWINDSMASSPTRTIVGLEAARKKPIVIVGGYDKHIPFDELGDRLNELAKTVILCGDTAEKIRSAILNSRAWQGLPLKTAEDLQDAVRLADACAEEGDIVMLSPACASFDRFKNFEERGNLFKQYVRELEE